MLINPNGSHRLWKRCQDDAATVIGLIQRDFQQNRAVSAELIAGTVGQHPNSIRNQLNPNNSTDHALSRPLARIMLAAKLLDATGWLERLCQFFGGHFVPTARVVRVIDTDVAAAKTMQVASSAFEALAKARLPESDGGQEITRQEAMLISARFDELELHCETTKTTVKAVAKRGANRSQVELFETAVEAG